MNRLKILITVFLTTFCLELSAQLPKISRKWQKEFIDGQFEPLNNDEYFSHDYSNILSNQLRFEGDGWSTYIGVFGPKNRRIDFHLETSKISDTGYKITGKSKLGNNIRNLRGSIKLKAVFKTASMANILMFEYELNEPGDREGDGKFVGIGTIAFMIKDGNPNIFWAASGDYRQYNSMFVGAWNRNNSDVTRDCIFSFKPSGTNTKLPFRSHLYKEFEEEDECKCYFEFKDEIRPNGWEDYDDQGNNKKTWWKH